MQNSDWNIANEHVKAREWTEALVAFDRAIDALPDNPDLIHDRAVCLFNLGRKKEALIQLDRAVTIQPDYSYRYASRAYMRSALKDIHGAIEDYKTALELDPEDAITLNNLGMLEEQLGYKQEANDRFKVADELNEIMNEQGISYEESRVTLKEFRKRESGDDQNMDPGESSVPTEPEPSGAWQSRLKEVKRVFTTRDSFKEFLAFLRNGFKLGAQKNSRRDDIS